MPTTLVHLVRHGESAGNVDPSLPRGGDPPLTARGEGQARQAASALARLGIEALCCSPLRRARETAAPIAAAAGAPIVIVPEFGEVDMGALSDAADAGARAERDRLFAAWLAGDRTRAFPGGEDFAAVTRRVAHGLRLVARHRSVAVVTHRMAIAAAASLCAGASAAGPTGPCANGSITTLRRDGEGWTLASWGDARHLG